MTSALEAQSFQMKGLPTDRDESMLQLSLHYRDSVLAREERAAPGRILAGDRIPDATDLVCNGKPARLFDLLRGPRPTVLAIGEGWGDALAALRARFPEAQLAIVQVGPNGPVVDAEGRLGPAWGLPARPCSSFARTSTSVWRPTAPTRHRSRPICGV